MDFELARKNMVNGQLKPNKVKDRNLLNAFLNVPSLNSIDFLTSIKVTSFFFINLFQLTGST